MVSCVAASTPLAWARAAVGKSAAASAVPSRKAAVVATQRDLDGVLKAALRAEGKIARERRVLATRRSRNQRNGALKA